MCNDNCRQGRDCDCGIRPARGIFNGLLIAIPFWLAVIALVFLTSCAVIAAIDSTVVLKDIHIPPPGEYTICTKVTLTDGYAESLAKSSKMCDGLNWECAHIGPFDGMQLIAPAPTSFNDRTAIFLLGHGLLHNLGGTHE